MQLPEMIDTGIEKAGNQRALAKVLGIPEQNLSAARHGKRGLPSVACGKLAEIIGIDRWTVIAASELVTEKNEEKRAYLAPFVLDQTRKAATWLIAIASAATVGTLAPSEAWATVDTFKVSPSTAQPAPLTNMTSGSMYIM